MKHVSSRCRAWACFTHFKRSMATQVRIPKTQIVLRISEEWTDKDSAADVRSANVHPAHFQVRFDASLQPRSSLPSRNTYPWAAQQ